MIVLNCRAMRAARCVLASIFFTLVPSSALAATTLTPLHDAATYRGYASSTTLPVSFWDHALIKFDLSDLSGSINSATLRVFYVDNSAVQLSVWPRFDDSWDESGAAVAGGTSGANRPLASVSAAAAGYVEFDVTDFVVNEYAGNLLASFELTTPLGNWRRLASRESTNPPQLIVDTGDTEPALLSQITVSPDSAEIPLGGRLQFEALGLDQFGDTIGISPLWDVSGGGIVDNAGFFTATDLGGPFALRASDGGISGTATLSVVPESVANLPPLASFETSAVTGNAPLRVDFSSTATDSDGSIVAWLWNFGDAGSSTLASPSHTFERAGSFEVNLTVTDNLGAAASSSRSIVVSPAPDSGTGSETTLTPVADAATISGRNTTPTIPVSLWNHALLRFDLSSVSAPLSKASLRVYYLDRDSVQLNLTAHSDTAWLDSASATPPRGQSSSAATLGSATTNGPGYVEFDVTDYVAAELESDGSAGFEIATPLGTWRYISSREGSFTPQLVIESGEAAAPVLTELNISPTSAEVLLGDGLDFDVQALDQNGNPMPVVPDWSVSGGGSVDANGFFSATSVGGPFNLSVSAGSLTASANVTVINPLPANLPPVAAFSASPSSGTAPLLVQFSSQSSDSDGSIVAYSWNFGDGSSSTLASPAHSFTTAGVYSVTLSVTDDDAATHSVSQTITVSAAAVPNLPPVAAFSASPSSGTAPLLVQFSSQSSDSDGSIVAYSWNFGDGSSSTLASPAHSFTTAGVYNVTLSVTDDDAATHSVSQTITVSSDPGNSGADSEITLLPLHDNASYPNYGTQTQLPVSFWDHAFVKFDTSTVNATVASARLRVFYKGSSSVLLNLYSYANNTWSETERPTKRVSTVSTPLDSATVAAPGYVEFDVSDYVENERLAGGLVSFELSTPLNGWQFIGSRESATPPQLIIETGDSIPAELERINISPADSQVILWQQQRFTAVGLDQYGSTVEISPRWSVSGGGSMDPDGLFTALVAGGPYTISASDGDVTATTRVSVTPPGYTPPNLVISEIHYQPAQGENYEFVEIANPGADRVELAGFRFSAGITYTFPAGIGINAGERLIVSREAALYSGGEFQVVQWSSGDLSNTGETITLVDALGNIIDSVSYAGTAPWRGAASGHGASLELVDLASDNSLPASWQASSVIGGTPGTSASSSDPVLMRLTLTPAARDVILGSTAVFTLQGYDQWDNSIAASALWNVSGGGSINGLGVFQASSVGGPFTVTANVGTLQATAQVKVLGNIVGSADYTTVRTSANAGAPEASRFLNQATFGSTLYEINWLLHHQLDYSAWIERQLALPVTYHSSLPHGAHQSGRMEAWFQAAIHADDQLRQRTAWALSQIFVISDLPDLIYTHPQGTFAYYDMLLKHSFGNFRELLEAVSKDLTMGIYLSLKNSQKADSSGTRPDENYARELMQLFSIGLVELNQDGSIVKRNGAPVPSYQQHDVEELARALTGWSSANAWLWAHDFSRPMIPYANYHDNGSKSFLGQTLPAGQTAEKDMDDALDIIFNHPNVGPFIGKQLIQRLVTSNPSAAYIGRVAASFNDNGDGQRGDLSAVIRAVLLDPEARSVHAPEEGFGKIREPLLKQVDLWRSFSRKGSAYRYARPEVDFLQAPLRARSVFNFYYPDFGPSGPLQDAGLVAPEIQIITDSSVTSTNNRLLITSMGKHWNTMVELDVSVPLSLAANTNRLIDYLDLILLQGAMSNELRSSLRAHLTANLSMPAEERVRDVIYLVAASAEYAVQQ